MNGLVLGITLIVIIVLFMFHTNQTPYFLSSIVVTLPRQIQVLQNMYEASSCLSKIPVMKASLQALLSSLSLPKNALNKFINWEKIAINGALVKSYDSLLAMASLPNRYQITGENGAGKTSLLLQLKKDLGQRYIPSNPEDLGAYIQGSTGQIISKQLQEALNSTCQYILLDEWNASLDSQSASSTKR